MVVIQSKASVSTTLSATRKNRRRVIRKNPRRANAAETPPVLELSITDGQDTETPPKTDRPTATPADGDDDELMIDADAPPVPHTGSAPAFPPLPASALRTGLKSETRRIPIPPHRMTPLKKDWVSIFGPMTEILGLQVRMNVQRRCVEARVSLSTLSRVEEKSTKSAGRHQNIQRTLVPSKRVPILSRLMPSASMSM